MRRRADERPSAPPPREKYLYIVHGVEFLATQRRRIASPRTCGALRACDHWETFSPLVNHRKMTRCAPRRRKRTRCRRYNARDRLKGQSLITRRLYSRGVAIILGASRICRVSCRRSGESIEFTNTPSRRGHNVHFSSFIREAYLGGGMSFHPSGLGVSLPPGGGSPGSPCVPKW